MSDMKSWAEREVEIACARERKNSTEDGEWDYGCACYKSALKAYKSLMEDGHSGFSFSLTKNVLNRLMDDLPLTPIEDTPDIWRYCYTTNDSECYQCDRMTSLFKNVSRDGTVTYSDVNRFYSVSINDPKNTWSSGLVHRIMNETFPITMPYYPTKPRPVYCEEFLTDRKNGDFDTVGIFYTVNTEGDKIYVNRFFKEGEHDWIEISMDEYAERIRIAEKLEKESLNEMPV